MLNLVKVTNLKKSYGSKEAVKGISFNIKENEILGLLGPNGSGKTTTIGMLLGLLKPSAGEIILFDRSWYNRAGVEIVMGFCTNAQYKQFLVDTPKLEKMITDSGIKLIKL